MTPLPPGFVLDGAPPLPAGFVLDGAEPAKTEGKDFLSTDTAKAVAGSLWQQTKDAAGGLVRGAGSIGATLLAPHDALEDYLEKRMRGTTLSDLIVGKKEGISRNDQRRKDMTDATRELGANPDSLTYGAFKLGGEVAGTAGAGPAIATGMQAIPRVAQTMPGVINAIRTGGMQAGTGGVVANTAARTAGGATTGLAAAGLVNPDDALTGAMIGGAMPGAVQLAGKAGGAAGSLFRGPQQAPDVSQAIQAARQSGYVIPPSQANATLANRLLEGLSGKITTAQNASARNQAVTNRLAAQSVGLPVDVPITPQALKGVRDAAGQAYDAVAQSGTVRPTPAYNAALDQIVKPHLVAYAGFPNATPSPVVKLVDSLRSDVFDAASAVAKIKELRSAADDAFRTGNTDVARASKSAAKALEDAIETHLQSIGSPDLLQNFRDARQLIAKTYSVEKALNPTTGTVDARKLGAQIKKGKPLSGDLQSAGAFANRFPKASQPVEGMGSLPQTSPLDWAMGGGLAMGTGNPLMLAGMAARPAARAAVLSPLVQNRLVQQPSPGLLSPDLLQLLVRAAPSAGADR